MAGEITPDAVLQHTKPTDGFMCPMKANTYGIEFLEFEIKDYDTNESIFKVKKDPDAPPVTLPDDLDPALEKQLRTVQYQFPVKFLKFQTVRTALVFSVGDQPVENFRMIERHYFKDELIRSYDFVFGFCIPGSTNSWEAIYPMPEIENDRMLQMVGNPYETKSDSFYFVGDKLVMHNKAEYKYQGD